MVSLLCRCKEKFLEKDRFGGLFAFLGGGGRRIFSKNEVDKNLKIFSDFLTILTNLLKNNDFYFDQIRPKFAFFNPDSVELKQELGIRGFFIWLIPL